MTEDPTARALRAVRVLAADLAAEQRETAALRRRVAELQVELDRLRAATEAPSRPLTAHHAPEPRPPAGPVAGRS